MALSPRAQLGAAMLRACDSPSSSGRGGGFAPYLGAILRGLVRREMSEEMRAAMHASGMKPTLAVSRDGILYWCPEYVVTITVDELAWALVHEALHVAFKHSDRAEALGIVPDSTPDKAGETATNARLWNLATDCAINQEIRKVGQLPNADKLAFPERFGLPPGLVAEEYYHRLKKQPPPPDGGGCGKGHCGGAGGRPVPGEAPGGKRDPDGRSEAEMSRMRQATAEAVRDHAAKNRGLVPAELVRWADEMLKPAKIPWQQKLAHAVRGSVAHKTGAVDYTWTRVSRRQAGVGFGPGRAVVPALHAPIPDVAVVIDTSGSMSEKQLTAAMSEVDGVLKTIGAAVTIVVCDARVHGVRPVRTATEAIKLLKGGGGTAMAPAFTAVEKLRPRPGVTIVMTDGYIDDPPQPSFDVVWCLINSAANFAMDYGQIVHVEEE